MMVEQRRGSYMITTDRAQLDVGMIHEYLSRGSYWAQGRPEEVVRRSIKNSLCFGLFEDARQVGFARVVTDYATFGWLCDVFVLESKRGRGLGKWLVEFIAAHHDLRNLDLFVLATRDAHELYRRHGGFDQLQAPERWMTKRIEQLGSGQGTSCDRTPGNPPGCCAG